MKATSWLMVVYLAQKMENCVKVMWVCEPRMQIKKFLGGSLAQVGQGSRGSGPLKQSIH